MFGYFALTFVTPEILQALGIEVKGFNALSAGLVMGIMIVPTIASISEDAMRAVPQGLREGAYGLGSTKRQVAMRVVFPAALSGIVAAIVLGISRGIGETMIVLLAAGLQPNFGINPARWIRDDHDLHGLGRGRRQPRRLDRLPVDLRLRHDPLLPHARR